MHAPFGACCKADSAMDKKSVLRTQITGSWKEMLNSA